MSTDRDVTGIVRSWLEEGVTALPDRVLDSVLDQVPATPQRRVTWWPVRRLTNMNNTVKYGLAAAGLSLSLLLGGYSYREGKKDALPSAGVANAVVMQAPVADR